MINTSGDLRVWWIPQVPGKPFHVPVANLAEAKFILQVLADYDKFQLNHRIKGDYANAGGLHVFDEEFFKEDGIGWTEWSSCDGDSIDDLTTEQVRENLPAAIHTGL